MGERGDQELSSITSNMTTIAKRHIPEIQEQHLKEFMTSSLRDTPHFNQENAFFSDKNMETPNFKERSSI